MKASLTFEQNARNLLDSYALFPQQIDSIMQHAKDSPANEAMKDRWGDTAGDYPPPNARRAANFHHLVRH